MCILPKHIFNVELPSSVFRLPSAPIKTSNSYCDTGWSSGSTFALQPVSIKWLPFRNEVAIKIEKFQRRDSLSPSAVVDGGTRDSKPTPSWISTPSSNATFSNMHWTCLMPAKKVFIYKEPKWLEESSSFFSHSFRNECYKIVDQ